MRRWLWSLAAGAFLAVQPAGAGAAAPLVSFEAYSRLDDAARYHYVRQLMTERWSQATAAYLSGPDLEGQRSFMTRVLERASRGDRLSANGYERLLDDLERHEQAAIQHHARSYRIAVYQTFHADREQLDRRMEAGRLVFERWRQTGSLADDRPVLLDWITGATSRIRTGDAKLPAMPAFGSHPVEVIAAKPVIPAVPETPRLPLPLPAPAPQVPSQTSKIPRPAKPESIPAPVAAPPVAARPLNTPFPINAEPVAAPPAWPNVPRVARQIDIVTPNVAAAASTVKVAPAKPRRPPIGTRDPKLLAELPEAITPDTGPTPRREPIASQPRVAAVEVPALPPVPTIVQKSPPAQLPSPQAPATPREILHADANDVRIDVSELTARVAGYNLALAKLAERLQLERRFKAAELAICVDELSDLNRRGADLQLYTYLISPEERIGVGRMEAPDVAIALLGNRIFSLRARLLDSPFEGTIDEQQAELATLEKLSQRLARLANIAAPAQSAQRVD